MAVVPTFYEVYEQWLNSCSMVPENWHCEVY